MDKQAQDPQRFSRLPAGRPVRRRRHGLRQRSAPRDPPPDRSAERGAAARDPLDRALGGRRSAGLVPDDGQRAGVDLARSGRGAWSFLVSKSRFEPTAAGASPPERKPEAAAIANREASRDDQIRRGAGELRRDRPALRHGASGAGRVPTGCCGPCTSGSKADSTKTSSRSWPTAPWPWSSRPSSMPVSTS